MVQKVFSSVLVAVLFIFVVNVKASSRITTQQYIETYKDWAVDDMKKTGIPASIKLAQGILESGSGNSKLAREANNHFGVKCHDWNGDRVFHDDDEKNECFRKYRDPRQSFEDHSTFLTTRDRYARLFDLASTDYKSWAKGLREAGYATNPQYANLLIKIIEDNKLYELDQNITERAKKGNRDTQRRQGADVIVIDPFGARNTDYNNGVKYVEVLQGDTFESIARTFGMRAWELPTYNDLPANADISKFKILYLESKRRNAHPDHEYHTVKDGETMHEISQVYGVRLSRLYHLNRMNNGTQPNPGDRLNLRKRVKP